METIQFLVNLLYLYLAAGFVFAVFFVWRGARQIDGMAKGISLQTRLLLLPGSAALWPVLLWKWLKARRANQSKKNENL